jgi:hypothetical protein
MKEGDLRNNFGGMSSEGGKGGSRRLMSRGIDVLTGEIITHCMTGRCVRLCEVRNYEGYGKCVRKR